MGHHIGLLIWNAKTAQPAALLGMLFPKGQLLKEFEDRYSAFDLSSERGAIAILPNFMVLAQKNLAMSIVLEAEYPTQTPTQEALLQLSMIGDVFMIYQHAISEICGHVLISKGRQIAFHIGDDNGDQLESTAELLPPWYLLAPRKYQEDYAFAAAEAMLGATMPLLLDDDPKWQLIELS